MKSKTKEKYAVNWKVYWRILGYVKKYIKLVILCIVLSTVISFLHFGALGTIKPLGDVLFGDGSKLLLEKMQQYGPLGSWLAAWLKEHVFTDTYRALYLITIFGLSIALLKNLLRFFQEYLAGYIMNKVTMDISNELFAKVQRLPVRYFSKEGASQISARFVNDIPMMGRGLKDVFGKAVREPLKAVGTFCLALIIHWQLTLLTCVIFPVIAVSLKKLGKKVKRGAKKTLVEQGKIMAILQETFSGTKIVKAYQLESPIIDKFRGENKKLFRYEMKLVAADAAASPMMETFVILAGAGILILSAHLVMTKKMSMGDFFAFYGALAAMFDPIRKLSDFNNRLNTSTASGERVFEMMDRNVEIEDHPEATVLEPIQKGIELRQVCFSYEPGIPVLQDITCRVEHGERIALVGKSGSGKSTLVSLLLRLYDVDDGAILVDGKDIRKVTLESLRKQIGLVTQEAFLFNTTIAANIACRENGFSQEALEKAAISSYSNLFIENLAEKYQTLYGAGGIDLSGGQKHRIALARAIYKEPTILILDEAMANLDAESENYILDALERFSKGRTTFIIAHRFSTIMNVDRILVLNEGKLDGFGTHQELIQRSQVYKSLYEKQTLK